MIQNVFKSIKSIVTGIGNVLKEGLKVIINLGNQLVSGVMRIASQIMTGLTNLTAQLGPIITNLVNAVMSGINSLMTGLVQASSNIGPIVQNVLKAVMDGLNTVMNGLVQASNTLPTILGNLGRAVGSFFTAMTAGLTTFATGMSVMTPIGVPVGLVVVGMALGIAAALNIAEPAIQAITPLLLGLASIIGDTFVKVLEAAGPIITSIFEGIALIIQSVGDVIAKVITAVGDSLVKIGSISGENLMAVGLALPVLAAGLIALGAAELIQGITSFIGSLFGGGKNIWDKLITLSTYGPGLKMAADAAASLGPSFSKLGAVGKGENLGALMENIKVALAKMDQATIDKMKSISPSLLQLATAASYISGVKYNNQLATMTTQIQQLLDPKVMTLITKNLPTLNSFKDTITAFSNSTASLSTSLTTVNIQFTALLKNIGTYASVGTGLDSTTAAVVRMTEALKELAAINTANIANLPWDAMSNFGKAVANTTPSVMGKPLASGIIDPTLKELQAISSNTKALVELTKELEIIAAAQYKADTGKDNVSSVNLKIDGKTLAAASVRYTNNNKGQRKPGT